MEKIKALLIDLDGTIYQNGQLIDNTLSTIKQLDRRKIPYRFITNSTTKSRQTICSHLGSLGLKITKSSIYTTLYSASNYCLNNNISNIKLISHTDNLKCDLNGLNLVFFSCFDNVGGFLASLLFLASLIFLTFVLSLPAFLDFLS